MEALFLKVVNLSVTASWVIAAVLLLRLLMRSVLRKYTCLLWLVVLFRLLCPVSLEAEFSLVPQHTAIQPEIVYTTPQVDTQSAVVNDIADATVNPILTEHSAPTPQNSANPLQIYLFAASWLWVLGIVILCGYTLFSWLRLRRQLREAVPDEEGIYLCDAIPSPFVFGIVRPRIYLPYGLRDAERRYVLLHERSHIARWDFLLKPLFWLAVMVHWLNPLVWVAWHYFSCDLELACDERAIAQLDNSQKQGYSHTLVQLAVQQRKLRCPIAFGNNSTKQRIAHVLRYKKQALWITGVVLVITVMMAVALGVNPVPNERLGDLRPELENPVCTAVELQWGTITVKIEDTAQVRQLQKLAADLEVQQKGKNRRNHIFSEDQAYHVAVVNRIQFLTGAEVVESIYFNGTFTQIEPKDNGQENCAYLQVNEPQVLRELFSAQGQSVLAQQADATFAADLDNDDRSEQIIVNVNQQAEDYLAEVAIYRSDGVVLSWDRLNQPHAAWGNLYLCRKDGQDYLLRYRPWIGGSYADYYWELQQFDDAGQPITIQRNSIKFSINPEQYQFNVDEIYDFLQEVDELLQDAVLLASTENGRLQYSTVDKQICPTAESYLYDENGWLSSFVHGDALKLDLREQLQLVQNEIYFARPQVALEQWLQYHADFDGQHQKLLAPELCTIDKKQCVSFELCWREGNQIIARYAVSTQDPDDFKAAEQGRCYYQWQDDKWVLLDDESQNKDVKKAAEHWAQSYAGRDGKLRYGLMNKQLQEEINQISKDDAVASWMPVLVINEETGSSNRYLRGSSPWVKEYRTEIFAPEKKNELVTALIDYAMTDSGQGDYVYQEVLTFDKDGKVADCRVVVDCLERAQYDALLELAANNDSTANAWRYDPEQVAQKFVNDYLKRSGGTFGEWNADTSSIVYTDADGVNYSIRLYQPLQYAEYKTQNYWAVASYTAELDGQLQQYNVQGDMWASLHIQ